MNRTTYPALVAIRPDWSDAADADRLRRIAADEAAEFVAAFRAAGLDAVADVFAARYAAANA